MSADYFAAILTMAMHTGSPGLRAKALGRLVAALGDGPPPPESGTVLHDGETILQASDGMTSLLGVRAGRLVGRPVASIVHPLRRAALVAGIRLAWASGPVTGRALLVRRGQPVAVDATAHVVVVAGARLLRVDFVAL